MSEVKELNNWIEGRRFTVVTFLVSSLAATILVALMKQDPGREFDREYLGDNGCLTGTSYDPEEGAKLEQKKIDGYKILESTPTSDTGASPAHLVLEIHAHGLFQQPTLTPADIATAGVLAIARCPGSEGGL